MFSRTVSPLKGGPKIANGDHSATDVISTTVDLKSAWTNEMDLNSRSKLSLSLSLSLWGELLKVKLNDVKQESQEGNWKKSNHKSP